ncbi:hypothetical protein [Parabacteroides pacaensis]|uniref:hypothetical protein n=1 Tax=Parabacteroides pacaensis TaxID=2086575 RepID=UPI000D0FBFBC|nr:hypothetical protein [Parabacteroides pacaensis]
MKIKFTSHIKQHAGDILLECQDSFNYNLENLSFAVSDGVSQAYRPELWSRILTEAYVNNSDTFFIKDSENNLVVNPILGLSSKWNEAETFAYKNATPQEQFVLDMKKNAINVGAATFIGVKLVKEGVSFQTIGDSVLFFFDYETKELKAYSSMMPESGDMIFNNNPEYIDSNECNHGKIISGLLPYREGILFLATDALSDWIVERRFPSDKIERILRELMAISTHNAFDIWVDNARNEANPTKLKDDDTTFIAIEFIDTSDSNIEVGHNFTVKFDALMKDSLLSELNSQRSELEEIRSAKSKSELALRGKEKQITGLTSDLESCKTEVENKRAEITRLNSEIKSLNSQIKKLKADLSVSDSECRRLRSANSTLGTDKSNLENELRTSRQEVSRLKSENKKLESIINAHKSSPAPSTKKNEEIAQLNSELNEAATKMQILQSELDLLRDIVKKTRTLYDMNGKLTTLDLNTLFSQILGETLVSQEVHIQQTIVVGKPTGDGGFQM